MRPMTPSLTPRLHPTLLTQTLTRAITDAGSGGGGFVPNAAFFAGSPGAAYDPLTLSSFTQDSAGTTPATLLGQAAGRMLDLSGNGNHATLKNVAAPPTIARSGLMLTSSEGMASPAINFAPSTVITVVFRVRSRDDATSVVLELGPNGYTPVGGFYVSKSNSTDNKYGFATHTAYAVTTAAYVPPRADVVSIIFDTVNNDYKIRINGVADPNGAGLLTSGAFQSLPLNIGFRTGAGLPVVNGILGRNLTIGRELTESELLAAEGWAGAGNVAMVGDIGDSTVGQYSTFQPVTSFLDAGGAGIAFAGDAIAQQKTRWTAYASKASLTGVVVQIGLNDLDPAEAASVAIARVQDLINTINADVSVPVLVAKMIPCRARLITLYGDTNGPIAYQKWLDMNAAYAGTGPTPITGVDARITSHEAQMNDGSGNLAAPYNSGDGIHENNVGRAVVAGAWEVALRGLGVL